MKNSGSQGVGPKAANGQGNVSYGQPYIANTNDSSGSNQRQNQNLKSYINELKKVSSQNKQGGKRGHSSNRNNASNMMRST